MTESSRSKSKRIFKNTILLYGRTFLTMIISLYTSRINLEALGIDNYGVYNVVGGFIAIFAIITGPLTNSFSRYLSYAVGKRDITYSANLFSTILNFQILLGFGIVILAEPIGIWFLNNKLNIPSESILAANWVLQCSILNFVVGLINLPYSCSLVAHEKMNIYAMMGILDSLLRLALCYFLFVTPFNVLVTYAVGQLLIYVLMRIIYGIYCTRKFKECRYTATIDKPLLKEISGFAGWSFLGSTAYILNTQGVAVLMNMFFGVAVNAAKAIAAQVESAVLSLVANFSVAFTPQITKSYAEGDKEYMFSIMCRGAKFSVFLMLLFIIPLEFEANTVLGLWLKEVPEWSVTFLRLSLICATINSLGGPFYQGIMANGNIKNYQITMTIIGGLVFPLTWLFFKMGFESYIFYLIYIFIYFILIWVRVYFTEKIIGFKISLFIKKVFGPILLCTVIAVIIPIIIALSLQPGWERLLILTFSSTIWTSMSILFVGMSQPERNFVVSTIRRYCSHSKKTKSDAL